MNLNTVILQNRSYHEYKLFIVFFMSYHNWLVVWKFQTVSWKLEKLWLFRLTIFRDIPSSMNSKNSINFKNSENPKGYKNSKALNTLETLGTKSIL